MLGISGLLVLPAGLLALSLTRAVECHQLQWPHNSPRTTKYFTEHEELVRRDVEAGRRLQSETPAGVQKMRDDPGEKFFLQYWTFGDQATQASVLDPVAGEHHDRTLGADHQLEPYANASNTLPALPPVMLHMKQDRSDWWLFRRETFARDFQCPAGTSACSSVGQSDLCCPNGESCVSTSGGVGCCPAGATCGGSVASCDTNAGYTSCSSDSNGGCCIPGAECLGSGCVFYGTETVTTTLPTATITTGESTEPSTSSPSRASTQVIVSGFTTTATVTITGEGETQTTTVAVPTTITISPPLSSSTASALCSQGSFTCPASLGGGCCSNGQSCASGAQCADATSSTTTTVTPSAPVRPTSVDTSSQTTVSAAEVTSYDGCPTGFYMCSAVYLGGCCRVNRNCDSTSCPAADSTDVVTSGVTIAAPVATAAATGNEGSCASGWYSCAASAGGGCCPSGYLCGSSCTATVSGVSSQPKETPSSANMDAIAWSFLALSCATAVGMLWL